MTDEYYGLPPQGYAEEYTDNICILPSPGDPYLHSDAGDLQHRTKFEMGMVLRNNTVYIPGGDANSVMTVGGDSLSFAEFQKLGFDPTSRVIAGSPSVSQIIAWAEPLLGLGTEHATLMV